MPGPHLLVVADGMGGHAGGDVASSLAIGELAPLDGESHGSDDAARAPRAGGPRGPRRTPRAWSRRSRSSPAWGRRSRP